LGFYANYHSMRFVEGTLVLRLRALPEPAALDELAGDFSDIVSSGTIEVVDTTPAEIADDDHVDLPRLGFRFDRRSWSRLRMLIDRLNGRSRLRLPAP